MNISRNQFNGTSGLGYELDPLDDGFSVLALDELSGDDARVLRSARVSFGRQDEVMDEQRAYKLIKYLLQHNHNSPFEHTLITFFVEWPIFLDRQGVRHRIGVSKNERSARYTELSEAVYVPRRFRKQSSNNRQASVQADFADNEEMQRLYFEQTDAAFKLYRELLARGVCREQARGILPLCSYVSSYYTFNLRSLLHFIELRSAPGAQWEIQQYADAMQRLVEPFFPMVFRAWKELQEAKT